MMELGVEVLEKLSRKRGTKAEHGVWRVLMWEDQCFLSEDNRGGLSLGCTGWEMRCPWLKNAAAGAVLPEMESGSCDSLAV